MDFQECLLNFIVSLFDAANGPFKFQSVLAVRYFEDLLQHLKILKKIKKVKELF